MIHTETVFRSSSDNQFVDQRIAFALHLLEGTVVLVRVRRPAHGNFVTRGRSPGSNYGLFLIGVVELAIDRQHGDGNFQHHRVDVEASHRIGRVIVRVVRVFCGRKYAAYSHSEVQSIESRAQIDEERVIGRSGPNAQVVAQAIDSLVEQGLIVGHGQRADVGRNSVERLSTAQASGHAILDHGDGIGLPQTKTG